MIDLSIVLANPDLCQSFSVLRTTGSFQAGRFVPQTSTVAMYGSVQQADADTLQQVPEGDRVTGAIVAFTPSPIYVTREQAPEGLSDILIWNGQQYRVAQVWDWSAAGFYKAFAVRMGGS